VTTDKKAVGKAARELVQSYGAKVSTQQMQDKLQNLYDYMASGYDGKDELTFTEAWRRAKDIARGRAPRGARGLKLRCMPPLSVMVASRPARGAWIEIAPPGHGATRYARSRPVRGAWIEIGQTAGC